ncbi:tyrosine-type recombinase/integrase [Paraburkholderia silviterrae]|uniref:Site-specific integrase n=1 Tax=Paraburkholderia silviterrae TaxID=2528715 RepID=A0A4R5LXF1_9BURK|nr:site-specific integrase [Paraburkholderia silviterrae]TDG16715.1 site-specific integrase [Paraburkholderia silviterrae]
MAQHQLFRIDRAFMRAIDTKIAKEYACDALRGFSVRVVESGAVSYSYRYVDADGKPRRSAGRALARPALRGALSRAVEWGLLATHPMAQVKKQRTPDPDAHQYLLPDEEARVRAALDVHNRTALDAWHAADIGLDWTYGDATTPLVLLAMALGCRRAELLKLEWSAVDFPNATVRFVDTTTKTATSRVVPLNAEALAVLKAWRKQSSHFRLVFPSPDGKGSLAVVPNWEKVRDAAKVERIRLKYHTMRHHVASRLVNSGVDLHTVGQILGHRDIATTKRCAHLAPRTPS